VTKLRLITGPKLIPVTKLCFLGGLKIILKSQQGNKL
jgi:hypothetical protein